MRAIMTISALIMLIGLVLWLVFTKFKRISDAWLAEAGKLMFFAGLLAWLLANGNKPGF